LPALKYLTLIETIGNQPYIFATNRMQENIGASELTHRVGTEFIDEAIATIAKTDIKVIVKTSGKAILLVDNVGVAQGIVSLVTMNAARNAPGITVRGYVDEREIDLAATGGDKISDAGRRISMAQEEIKRLSAVLPPKEARYPVLPILRPSQSSGLPAVSFRKADPGYAICAPGKSKELCQEHGRKRIRSELGDLAAFLRDDLEKFEKLDWWGVVHADGNGFSELFLNLAGNSKAETVGAYFDAYRDFSRDLVLCTKQAFRDTFDEMTKPTAERSAGRPLYLIPLVLGGDDLTVVCDGSRALEFAATYLKKFEAASNAPLLAGQQSSLRQFAPEGLTAAAGVSIVKPHFPFYRAYELAEALTYSAKKSWKGHGSALDFQTIYQDAAPDLDTLRRRWNVAGGHLTARPFLVTGMDDIHEHRTFDGLIAAAKELRRKGESGKSVLPRSQQHALRDALFEDEETTKARFKLVEKRYDLKWEKLASDGSLFFGDRRAILLDAMDVNDIGAES
jgi:hypothetical protein